MGIRVAGVSRQVFVDVIGLDSLLDMVAVGEILPLLVEDGEWEGALQLFQIPVEEGSEAYIGVRRHGSGNKG